jgi:hypothetical protein
MQEQADSQSKINELYSDLETHVNTNLELRSLIAQQARDLSEIRLQRGALRLEVVRAEGQLEILKALWEGADSSDVI